MESDMDVQRLFGFVVTIILLLLYVAAVVFAIMVVNCATTAGCSGSTVADFNGGWVTVLTAVGGLVSALVIAVLAVTKPGTNPATTVLALTASSQTSTTTIITAVTIGYLL